MNGSNHICCSLLTASLLSVVACDDQVSSEVTQETPCQVEVLSETDIPKEEALENLADLLSPWCRSELRSGDNAYEKHARMLAQLTDYDLRKVKTIRSGHNLRSNSEGSNSSGDHKTSTQLMHLVNFDEGGYAVVSADRRIPSVVLAVVDDGTISEGDFAAADSVIREEDIREEIPDFHLYNDTIGDFYSMAVSRRMVNAELYAYASAYTSSQSCD